MLAYRLRRLRTTGGEPEPLVESKTRFTFSLAIQAETLVYSTATPPDNGVGASLMAIDLATGAKSLLKEGPVPLEFSLAPDGGLVAFREGETPESSAEALRLVSLSTQESKVIPTKRLREFGWLDAQRLVLVEGVGDNLRQMRLRTVSTEGKVLTEAVVEGEGGAYAPHIGGDGSGISPEGKWVLATGKGEGLPIISLETGRVYRSPHYGWRGWLDAETLIGTFQGRLYAMPLAMAFDLTQSAPTVAVGK